MSTGSTNHEKAGQVQCTPRSAAKGLALRAECGRLSYNGHSNGGGITRRNGAVKGVNRRRRQACGVQNEAQAYGGSVIRTANTPVLLSGYSTLVKGTKVQK